MEFQITLTLEECTALQHLLEMVLESPTQGTDEDLFEDIQLLKVLEKIKSSEEQLSENAKKGSS